MQSVKMIQSDNTNKKSKPQIVLSPENYNKLKNLGKKGQTFDEIITKILAHQQGVLKIDATEQE